MGIILMFVVLGYLLVVVPLVLWVAGQVTRSKKTKWIVLPLLLIGPFWRPISGNHKHVLIEVGQ